MNKAFVAGVVFLGLSAADVSVAAVPSVAGKTFALAGKFGGNVAVACRIGGSHGQKVTARRGLTAQISFNEDGTFSWSNDTLGAGVLSGEWTQKGGKLDLDFDDPSAVSYIWLFGESYSTGIPGGSASASPLKYDFSGKLNGNGTSLKVIESGGFKIDASASLGGGSNSCKYRIRVNRTYTGKAE